MQLAKIERFKIYKKIEYWLSYIILFMPILLALQIRFQGLGLSIEYEKPGDISILTLMAVSLGVAASTGIYHAFFSVIATNTLSSELDSKYYMMYFPKVASKSNLYKVKSKVLTEALLLHVIIYLLVAFLFCYFLAGGVDNISNQIMDKYSFYYICNIIVMTIELIAFSNVSLMLGIFLKPLANILFSIGIYVVQLWLYNVPVIKYILPKFYTEKLLNMEDWISRWPIIKCTLMAIFVMLIYIAISQLIGRKFINKEG